MSFTYGELKQAIQDYAENDETTFVNNLPVFIKNTEEKILKNVQLSLFRKNATASMTTSNKYLSCPSDFLAPFSLSFVSGGSHVFVDFKDVDFIQTFAPDASVTGSPRYYAVFNVDNFILAPTPDDAYTAELHYYYRPTSLTAGSDSGTTWLSENASVAMLYGSLVEAYTFMKGEQDMMQMYFQSFTQALGALKQLGEAKEVTDEYRTGMVIRPKQ
jgi:hypothetical protein